MPRLAKVTDVLSAAAQAILGRGFAESKSAAVIAAEVKRATGETVAVRTVGRRGAEWRAKRDAFDRAKQQMAAMKAAGFDGSEMIHALALERLVEDPEALSGANPLKLQSLSLMAEEIRLKKRQLDIRERAVAVNEGRLKLLEAREDRAKAVLTDARPEITPEERERRMKEIYGLVA